jgi:hypothetical protein
MADAERDLAKSRAALVTAYEQ